MKHTASPALASDTTASVHPLVLEAIARENGTRRSYGNDEVSERTHNKLEQMFNRSAHVLFVPSGTGANVLSVGTLLQRTDSLLIARTGHMHVDECATVEANLGNRLVPIHTPDGKLTPDLLSTALGDSTMLNRPKPTVVSVTQPTELGTVYTNADLQDISGWCHEHGCALHIDGARFANALAHLGVTPVDMLVGVDVSAISLGFTKNGGLNGDVVLLPDSRRVTHDAARVSRLQLQLMQLPAKAWAIAASVEALLEDNLWINLAETANQRAQEIRAVLYAGARNQIGTMLPVETNGVFFTASPKLAEAIRDSYDCYSWRTDDELRLMAAHDTRPEVIQHLGTIVRA
jgi:threonine aldolase